MTTDTTYNEITTNYIKSNLSLLKNENFFYNSSRLEDLDCTSESTFFRKLMYGFSKLDAAANLISVGISLVAGVCVLTPLAAIDFLSTAVLKKNINLLSIIPILLAGVIKLTTTLVSCAALISFNLLSLTAWIPLRLASGVTGSVLFGVHTLFSKILGSCNRNSQSRSFSENQNSIYYQNPSLVIPPAPQTPPPSKNMAWA